MKREEAIELISKRLGPIGVSEPTCEEVLSILENAGMLPPMTKKKRSREINGTLIEWPIDVREWD